jgi:hypothetical protein
MVRSVVFFGFLRFPPPIKLNNITEILLKVALNTLNQTNQPRMVNLIQHYVIKFVSNLLQAEFFSTNKTDRHDIADILLKVAL